MDKSTGNDGGGITILPTRLFNYAGGYFTSARNPGPIAQIVPLYGSPIPFPAPLEHVLLELVSVQGVISWSHPATIARKLRIITSTFCHAQLPAATKFSAGLNCREFPWYNGLVHPDR